MNLQQKAEAWKKLSVFIDGRILVLDNWMGLENAIYSPEYDQKKAQIEILKDLRKKVKKQEVAFLLAVQEVRNYIKGANQLKTTQNMTTKQLLDEFEEKINDVFGVEK
ncbi:hypothetical protein LCGC14_0589210 [marine sediment metagenome]|uniref:Uncharacterized protein n=1 Tax=marine sediment metagenome TaxID=412755 RepID=A0A0F9RJ36_9ZZZZ